MVLRQRSTSYGVDDPSWRISRDGKGTERTITLDLDAFPRETYYPEGFIPSGVPVVKSATGDTYVPATTGAIDGFLAEAVHGIDPEGEENPLAALMWRGVVAAGLLPLGLSVDQVGRDSVAGRIRFE
jgi:hypothetical protein